MPAIFRRADTSAAADACSSPAVQATPAPSREAKRLFSRWNGERVKQFAARLKANARWMKQFLHGRK